MLLISEASSKEGEGHPPLHRLSLLSDQHHRDDQNQNHVHEHNNQHQDHRGVLIGHRHAHHHDLHNIPTVFATLVTFHE